MEPVQFGIIEEGKLAGKHIILNRRNGLPKNEYLVEKGQIMGQPNFGRFCLICEEEVPNQGCSIHSVEVNNDPVQNN